jgi:hypothetical protein
LEKDCAAWSSPWSSGSPSRVPSCNTRPTPPIAD